MLSFENRAREIYNRLIEQGKVVTVESIKNELMGRDHKQKMLLEQFRLVLQNMKLRINTGFSEGTVKNGDVKELHQQEFLFKQYLASDIALSSWI